MNEIGDPEGIGGGWTIVVPVKSLARAKSRLGSTLSPLQRRALVVAMATDVITACRECPSVSAVKVVSTDPDVAALATDLGAKFVTESGHRTAADSAITLRSDPLNAALAGALTGLTGAVAVVAADLPELDSRILTRILDSASQHRHSVVVDHRGEGTTMAMWTAGTDRVCLFGPGSAANFLRQGAVTLSVDERSGGAASRDVDIPSDVIRLAGRQVGLATAKTLREQLGQPSCRVHAESATMVW